MNQMKIILLIIPLLLIAQKKMFSQIGGISGSKLDSYCVDVVDHKKIEFEPALYRFNSGAFWNESALLFNHFETPDSLMTTEGMYMRITYGLWDKLEVGVNIDSDLTTSNWGMRFVVFQKEKLGLAGIAGINFPLLTKYKNRNLNPANYDYNFGGGLVSTYNFTDRLSSDLTLQYLVPFKPINWQNGTLKSASCDVGYYMENRHFQLISSVAYSQFTGDEYQSELLTFCYGFTIETDQFIFVCCLPRDIYGTNISKNQGLLLALTLTL